MRAVLQRVKEARVEVDGSVVGAIGGGLLVLLGVFRSDTEAEARALAQKALTLRVFTDHQGKMNLSVLDTGGSILVVSQFTLAADTRKGRRPSFDDAAPPGLARQLYECFVEQCRNSGVQTEMGRFQAHMTVHLVNDGPVTLVVDVKNCDNRV